MMPSWEELVDELFEKPEAFKPKLSGRLCWQCQGRMSTAEDAAYHGRCENCFAASVRGPSRGCGRKLGKQIVMDE